MIQSFYRSSWYPNEVSIATVRNLDHFSSCCGSRFYANNSRNYNVQGIALREGIHFTEGEFDNTTVKHLETPDGPITLTIRTKW